MSEHYDVIVIGTGAGGGTLARHLAPSGKRILLLERGDWLPREPGNWSTEDVFVDGRYISPDQWYDVKGKSFFQPQVHYFVGGATKLYGAALYRMREQDFGELRHHDGLSPAWPISLSPSICSAICRAGLLRSQAIPFPFRQGILSPTRYANQSGWWGRSFPGTFPS